MLHNIAPPSSLLWKAHKNANRALLHKGRAAKSERQRATIHYQSRILVPTDTTAAALPEGRAASAQDVMLRLGLMRHADPSGCWHILPVLQRSIDKLVALVDASMQRVGAYRVTLPVLNHYNSWLASGRAETMRLELMRLRDRRLGELCLGPTHEEAVTRMLIASLGHLPSYKLFPIRVYQIGPKFRDEHKPRFGLLRSREFLMKDAYVFDTSQEAALQSYESVRDAYRWLFRQLDIVPIEAEADSGAMGGQLSHEFLLDAPIGEDKVRRCRKSGRATTRTDDTTTALCANCSREQCCEHVETLRAIEVAHTFLLGTRYAELFQSRFVDAKGKKRTPVMSCYGVGVSRLIAAIFEQRLQERQNQLSWPLAIAPFRLCLIPAKRGAREEAASTATMCAFIDKAIGQAGDIDSEIIVDDQLEWSIGKRFKVAREFGHPYIAVFGKESPLVQLYCAPNYEEMRLSINEAVQLVITNTNAMVETDINMSDSG